MFLDEKMKDEMGRACSTHGRDYEVIRLVGQPEEKTQIGEYY
jgi:hypothetical protein